MNEILSGVRVVRPVRKWYMIKRWQSPDGSERVESQRIRLTPNATRLDVMRFVHPSLPEQCRTEKGWTRVDDRFHYEWKPGRDLQYR